MRSVLWLVLITVIAITLAGIAGSASADFDAYEGVIVQDTYDVDLKDPDGDNIGGITNYLSPVPVSGQVELTFWVQSGDDDTDIDKIVVGADPGFDITDSSDLSATESGDSGDWVVTGNATRLEYTAVSDSNNDADDALDEGEDLTIVITANITGDSGIYDVSFSVRNSVTHGDENVTVKDYTFYFLALEQGDMYLQTWFDYASLKTRPYLLITGTGVSFGQGAQGNFQRNFPDAYDVYRSTTDSVFLFFTEDPDLVEDLTFQAVNPNSGSEIRLEMHVSLFTARTVNGKSIVLEETEATGLNTPATLPNGGSFTYYYGPNILGPGNGSHYIDDENDDNDPVPDLQEIEDGTDPLDGTDYKAAKPESPDGTDGEDMSLIMIASLVVVILGIILGILLVKMGFIGGARPKKPKKKKKRKKKKEETVVKWEKPRQRKKRERAERVKAAKRKGEAEPEEEEPEEEGVEPEEEEPEEEAEPEEEEPEEEAEPEEEEPEEEGAELEEEDLEEEDEFEFDDDLDIDELEAELADLDDEIEELEEELEDDLDEDDLKAELDDDLDEDDLEAELDDDLDEDDLEAELDDDLDEDDLEAELDDDLDLDELESELEDI